MPSIGTTSSQYLSAIAPDWLDVDFDPRIVAVRRNREFLDIIKGMGGILSVAREDRREPVFNGFYENPLNSQISTTGATITGNGTSATPFDVSGLPAAGQGLVEVGDILQMPNGVNIIVMTVPSAAAFTARTVSGSSSTLTAGQWLTNITQASESGSNAPKPKRWGVTKLTNVIQIVRTTTQLTDVAQQSQVRTEVDGKPYVTPYEAFQLATSHYGNIMGALMQGQLGSTLFTDASPSIAGANGRGIQTTRGLDQYVVNFGVNDTVTTPGTVALADVADFINLLVAARSPKDYLVVGSTPSMILYSNLLKGLASSGALSSLRLQVDGRSIDFETENFMYGGFNIRLKTLGYLDNVEMVGSAATSLMPIAKKAFWIPTGTVNSIGNSAQPYIKLAHLPEPITTGANRYMSMDGLVCETHYDGLAPAATNGRRVLTMDMTSNIGLWLNNPQAFGAQTLFS